MSIKRTLFAFSALMLLPAAALAQDFPPPISPAPGTANIAVQHAFLDGNEEDSVNVTLTCSSGQISPSTVSLAHDESHIFVISNLPDQDVTCTVTQSEIGNYDGRYLCAPDIGDPDLGFDYDFPDNGIGGDEQCWPLDELDPFDPLEWSSTSCSFSDVFEGGVGYCINISVPEPVDVDVTKLWETFGAQQADFDPDVGIRLVCEDAIAVCAGSFCDPFEIVIPLSESDFNDEDGNYIGEGVAEFTVIPEWFPTADDPDDQLFTECVATEIGINNSQVDVDNGCLGIEVAAGMGDECTITNTWFFEGIPTLSQYGMAIMALLMLGVGFIGMRRFV